MVQLVYASAAKAPFTPNDLSNLLAKARPRNNLYQVTGMLLYHSGSFIQVLEGPESGVDIVYAAIQRDPRHSEFKMLLTRTIRSREFENWAMGFIDTTLLPRETPGMIDYYRALPQLIAASTDARKYLRFFQQGLCRQSVDGGSPTPQS
jgi:hypothetical protein